MDTIPESVLCKNIIIQYLFPYNNLDFKTFLNYRLISKQFDTIINDKYFPNRVNTTLNINNNRPPRHKQEIKSIYYRLKNYHRKYFPRQLLLTFNSQSRPKSQPHHFTALDEQYNPDHYYYNSNTGYKNFLNLPVLYKVKSTMLDNIYLDEEGNLWDKVKYSMKHNVMRGTDNIGRHFLAIRYLNITNNQLCLEMWYNNPIKNDININKLCPRRFPYILENCYHNTDYWTFASNDRPYIGEFSIEQLLVYNETLYTNYIRLLHDYSFIQLHNLLKYIQLPCCELRINKYNKDKPILPNDFYTENEPSIYEYIHLNVTKEFITLNYNMDKRSFVAITKQELDDYFESQALDESQEDSPFWSSEDSDG